MYYVLFIIKFFVGVFKRLVFGCCWFFRVICVLECMVLFICKLYK